MIFAAALAAALGTTCAPAPADKAWADRAIAAWQLQLRRIPELTPPPKVTVILFDKTCRLESGNVLQRQARPHWIFTRHGGQMRFADGIRIPAEVTSFAGEGKSGGPSFVMALPSVWAAGKVPPGSLGLDRLTTAVLLHEASHVAQKELVTRVGVLASDLGRGEEFSDDSIQEQFEKNPAFAAAMTEETRLLFAAAATRDLGEARTLARKAAASIKARRARWFTGKDQRLGEAEDQFLSMEGAGQYVGYSWLIDPQGGRLSEAAAMRGFGTRGKWWSQLQGLALVLAVKRLGLPGWRRWLWGQPKLVGTQLLDAALAR